MRSWKFGAIVKDNTCLINIKVVILEHSTKKVAEESKENKDARNGIKASK